MKCRICGNEQDNESYKVKEMMYGTENEFTYFQCSKCDCLQIEEIPSDISPYYPSDYYSYSSTGGSDNTNVNYLKRLLIKHRDRYAAFGRGMIGKLIYQKYPIGKFKGLSQLRLKKNTAILDVGCGSGAFLKDCSEVGFNNLLGIDPFNETNLKYVSGLQILKKDIENVSGKWDLVTFHHSFEHIPDQIKTLERVFELLNPTGHCIIRIPTVSSYAWQYYRENWVQLDAPRHFYLHSVKSMEILAQKTGFELSDVIYDSTAFQFWGSEQYKNGVPLRGKGSYAEDPMASMFSDEDITGFEKRSKELNFLKEGDQAIFYLRKQSV